MAGIDKNLVHFVGKSMAMPTNMGERAMGDEWSMHAPACSLSASTICRSSRSTISTSSPRKTKWCSGGGVGIPQVPVRG